MHSISKRYCFSSSIRCLCRLFLNRFSHDLRAPSQHRNPQYRLVESTWSIDDLCAQIESSVRDLLVLLPCALYLNERFSIVKIILEPDSATFHGAVFFYLTPLQWSFVPVGVLVGLVWRMFVHRLLHHPKLYRLSHKIHHLHAAKMTPFSAFTDHPLEFLSMEVVGTFFLPAALQPLPVQALAVLWAAQCVLGVLDHCNARIPFVCDSRYHLVHHQVGGTNSPTRPDPNLVVTYLPVYTHIHLLSCCFLCADKRVQLRRVRAAGPTVRHPPPTHRPGPGPGRGSRQRTEASEVEGPGRVSAKFPLPAVRKHSIPHIHIHTFQSYKHTYLNVCIQHPFGTASAVLVFFHH